MVSTSRYIIATMLLITLTAAAWGQITSTLKGIVVDKGGDPLVGVNVVIKGTTITAVTDICGEFSIPVGDNDLTIIFHDMTYEDLRTFEIRLKIHQITTDKIVFQIGGGRNRNKDCKQTIYKKQEKFRIE